MHKFYVLDTNILLHDPTSPMSFQDNTVVIPIEVIAEIDKFKKEQTERGRNAREVTRLLDKLREINSLAMGVALANGGMIKVHCEHDPAMEPIDPTLTWSGMAAVVAAAGEAKADTALLRVARQLARDNADHPVILVTKDVNLRIRADAMGLRAEDFTTDRVNPDELYSGQVEISVPPEQLDHFAQIAAIPLPPEANSLPNEYVLLKSADGTPRSALARVNAESNELVALLDTRRGVCGIKPHNKEQFFAFDALLNEKIKLVTVMGKAGTGKTLLAIAAGLEKVLHRKTYKGVLVSRPTVPMGRDVGFLPGSLDEKMLPWMKPIFDTLDFIATADGKLDPDELYQSGILQIEPLTYIRGRSISNHFVIIDEAQNLTPLEVKTVITRVGHDTKIVFTGDPYQIDNPYVDTSSNGFNTLVERFRAEPLAAHVELRKGERSELAERAANLL